MGSIGPGKTEGNPEHSDDLELARRCAKGDERALRIVFEAHEPRLRKLLVRRLGSLEDAEEVVATTFLRYWRSANRFRGDCSLKSFLTRIALNLCHDQGKRRREAVVVPPTFAEVENPMAERIREAMLRLDRHDQDLLTLYYLQEWDYDEICASLEIGYDVLRTRLVRARKRLRAFVESENDGRTI